MKLGLALVFSALLSGCAAFTSPKEKPVIEDKVGDNISTLSITAERRVVLVQRELGRFCAEPSPDVAESISSSLRAAANASVSRADTAAAVAAISAAKELSTSLSTLFVRSQGIQFMRDALYSLCQDKMNGVYGLSANSTSAPLAGNSAQSVSSTGQPNATDMPAYRTDRKQIIELASYLIRTELLLIEKRQLDAAILKVQDVQTEARKFAEEAKKAAAASMEDRVKVEQALEAAKAVKK